MEPELHGGWMLSEVMRRRPQTVGVFVALRMACPGCAMSPFETVAEAAAEYGLDTQELLARLGATPEDRK
jgi:hybrid cluster-associated redox disulfide protein